MGMLHIHNIRIIRKITDMKSIIIPSKYSRSIKQITQAKEYDRHQILHSLLVRYEQKIENYTMNELIKEREND
jgi:hypothetical protein